MKSLSKLIKTTSIAFITLGLFTSCSGGSSSKIIKIVKNCIFPYYDEYRTVDENINQYVQDVSVSTINSKPKAEWACEKQKDGSYQVCAYINADDAPLYILYSDLPVGNWNDRKLPDNSSMGTIHDDFLFGLMAIKNKYGNDNFNLSAIRKSYEQWAKNMSYKKSSDWRLSTMRNYNYPQYSWEFYEYPLEGAFFTVKSVEFQLGFSVESKKATTCSLSENEYSFMRIIFTDPNNNEYSLDLCVGDPFTVAEFIFNEESILRIFDENEFFQAVYLELNQQSAEETLLCF